MAIFAEGTNLNVMISRAQTVLRAHQMALRDCEDFYQWISAQSLADLQGLGMSQAGAQALQSAFADAHEEYNLHGGGGLGTYVLPYNFGASQRQVIGPTS